MIIIPLFPLRKETLRDDFPPLCYAIITKGGETMQNIGQHIRNLRKEKGLTQDALAAQLHVTRQTISNYENGKSEPDLDTLVRIAEVLGTDVNDLLAFPSPTIKAHTSKHWGKAICFVLLTAASYTLYYYIKNWAASYGGQHYNLSFLIVVAGFFQPMLLALLGYTSIYTLQQFAHFPAPITQYQSIHRTLWVFLFVSCTLYVPQVYWCCAELLRLSGILPLEQALPTYNLFFPKHFWLLETYPMIWRCAYTLCGAGIAITNKKSAEG